jgi:hypothetical protein
MNIKNHPSFALLKNRIATKVQKEVEQAVTDVLEETVNAVSQAITEGIDSVNIEGPDTFQAPVIPVPEPTNESLFIPVSGGPSIPLSMVKEHLAKS